MVWHSMTGYGQGHCAVEGEGHWRVELRSVNSKGLELRTTLPPQWGALDLRINRWIRQHIYRGRVDLRLDYVPPSAAYTFDLSRAEQTFKQLCAVTSALGLPPPTLADLLRLSHLWGANAPNTPAPDEESIERAWGHLQPALSDALGRFQASRQQEGEALRKLMGQHLDGLVGSLMAAKNLAQGRTAAYRQRLQERLDALTPPLSPPLDPGRLEAEVALIADRLDVAEELDRAQMHCDALRALIQSPPEDGLVGKRLDFLLQELTREANTLASKSRDAALTQQAMTLKNVVETMREQAANLQ